VFIQNVECPERFPIIGSMMHKVVGPDVIAILRAQPDARPVIQPEPPLLWLFPGHFKPLTPPQTFHTLVIHLPACISQQGSNAAITISAVLARQLDHVLDQAFFVSASMW
jgi:hypothetical protein